LSYAIDAGKHILPVVIKPCKIPLRLRRFQYVDFTEKPYRDSLTQIKHLLSNSRPIPKVDVDPYLEREDPAPVVTGPLIQHEPIFEPEPMEHGSSGVDRSQLRKFALPLLLAVIGIAAVAGIVAYASNQNTPAPATATSTPNAPVIMIAATGTAIPPPEQLTDKYGVTMRLVPAGDFIMGSDTGLADEQPVQTIYLDAFYIDKYEVTNVLYRECVEAGACPPPNRVNSVTHVAYYSRPDFENYPVVFVDWNMARSFCEWRGARLPTEAEWEKAARGPEGRTYPWGEKISCNEANYAGCQSDTTAVSNYGTGVSLYGVHNMAGNVYEWVSTLYTFYPYDPTDGREELNTTGDRVIRGGSWIKANSDEEVRSARRQRADPSLSTENIGFRCANTFDNFVPVTGLATATPKNSLTATSMAATNYVRRTKESDGSISTAGPSLVASSVPSSGPTLIQGLLVPITETTEAPTEPPTEPPAITKEPVVEPPPPTDPPVVEPPPPTDPPVVEPPPPADPPVDEPPPPIDPPVDEPPPPADPPAVP
jgi:formylglycine-generating enzyme required for sulfatase activity